MPQEYVSPMLSLVGSLFLALAAYLFGSKRQSAEIDKIESDILDSAVEREASLSEIALQLIAPLKERVKTLESKLSEISKENLQLKSNVDDLQGDILKLKSTNNALNRNIDDLQEKNESLNARISIYEGNNS